MERKDERRRYRRVRIEVGGTLRRDDGSAVPIVFDNLGPDGALIRAPELAHEAIAVGQRLALSFTLDSYPLPLSCEAVVRWRVEGGPGWAGGVQFVTLVPYERAALADHCERWIEARAGQAPAQAR